MSGIHPKVHEADLKGTLLSDRSIRTLLSQKAQTALAQWISEQTPESLPNKQLEPHQVPEVNWPILFDEHGQYHVLYRSSSDFDTYLSLKDKEKEDFLSSHTSDGKRDSLDKTPRQLGEGAFGEVVLSQSADGSWGACKCLTVEIDDPDAPEEPESIARIRTEHLIGALLDPSTTSSENQQSVTTKAAWGDDTKTTLHFYLFMPLLQGSALSKHLKVDLYSASAEEKLDMAIKLLEALQVLHTHNILHRDIKPDNIMIREDGSLSFIDLGLAVHLPDHTESYPGEQVGTLPYEAPEIHPTGEKPQSVYTKESDLFALGRVLFQILDPATLNIRDDSTMRDDKNATKYSEDAGRAIYDYRNAQLQKRMRAFFEENPNIAENILPMVDFFLTLIDPDPNKRPNVKDALEIACRLQTQLFEPERPDSHFGTYPSDSPPPAPYLNKHSAPPPPRGPETSTHAPPDPPKKGVGVKKV